MIKNKAYVLVADSIVFIHFAWTFLLFSGAVLVVFIHPYALFQIGIMTFTLLISLPFKGNCPLTLLEANLRRRTDPTYTNGNSFMTTYINKIFETNLNSKYVNLFITVLYVISYFVSALVIWR